MGVDWGQAFHLGGTGFGTVFLVLIILAVVILLTGLALKRMGHGKDEADNTQKGD